MTEMNHDHDNKTKANEVFEVSRPSASYGLVWNTQFRVEARFLHIIHILSQ